MTTKELIGLLKQQSPDAQVILSSNPEGNNFSPVSGYGVGFYLSVGVEEILRGNHGTFTDYIVDKAQKAIVLYPT